MKAKDVAEQANRGIVGIDEDLNIFGGYDEIFEQAGGAAACPEWLEPDDWDEMPKEEKRKLADMMIARWQRYKDAAV